MEEGEMIRILAGRTDVLTPRNGNTGWGEVVVFLTLHWGAEQGVGSSDIPDSSFSANSDLAS